MRPHTPGPWTAVATDDSDYRDEVFSKPGGPHWISIATITPKRDANGEWDDDTADANANLIAAAPDLLSLIRRQIALEGSSWHTDRYAQEAARLHADMRAAVAKAEGRE